MASLMAKRRIKKEANIKTEWITTIPVVHGVENIMVWEDMFRDDNP